ncbi:tetratricopeptide repeat protein [Hymenobacter chitinivorans]|uniref:Tetratricopeptide repeat protein n=1 Tax=Hymenobacter chitinivorans DSM 11115 TaxID=1121954 RepID=A0A2M9BQR9_9BACT|nr:hypothetical protein [Hymenobacter chitinivorans]PJJ60284.1 hypothetical protein CLV45_1709 [Hymenobacter chitinivorans DSM 11115]
MSPSRLLLAAALLFTACASPAPEGLTSPTTKAAALVRFTEELEVLAPVLEPAAGMSPVAYFVSKPAAGEQNSLSAAAHLLRQSPDLLNELASLYLGCFQPFGPHKADTAAQRTKLRALLRTRPDLDLGWVWLASTQKNPAQALTALSRAIALNQQVGYYYRQRALLYVLQDNYAAAVQDCQKALPLYQDRSGVYQELADIYALQHDDQHFSQTSEVRLAGLRHALTRLQRYPQAKGFQQDSIRRLRELLGYGHLTKALYFLETRHQPTVGCADLAKAAAYGVEEAPALQRQYCR